MLVRTFQIRTVVIKIDLVVFCSPDVIESSFALGWQIQSVELLIRSRILNVVHSPTEFFHIKLALSNFVVRLFLPYLHHPISLCLPRPRPICSLLQALPHLRQHSKILQRSPHIQLEDHWRQSALYGEHGRYGCTVPERPGDSRYVRCDSSHKLYWCRVDVGLTRCIPGESALDRSAQRTQLETLIDRIHIDF